MIDKILDFIVYYNLDLWSVVVGLISAGAWFLYKYGGVL